MKLSIPNPCNENWSNMLPQENGRFCKSCEKVVIDFSDIPDSEIEKYFIENAGKSVCGRFYNSQLYRINIQIPVNEIKNIRPRNYFLIALLFAFGSTLFSCTDNEGNTAKINKIEIIDTLQKAETHTDTTAKIDSAIKIQALVYDPQSWNINIPQLNFFNDYHTAGAVMYEPNNNLWQNGSFAFPQQMPVFPGGADTLKKFFDENVKYPPLTLPPMQGEVYVSVIVDAEGKLQDITVERSLYPALDSEAVRVVKLMPNWVRPIGLGTNENVKITIPVPFNSVIY